MHSQCVRCTIRRVQYQYYCNYQRRTESGCFQDWQYYDSRCDAADAWCGGDQALLAEAEAQAHRLVPVWQRWFRTLSTEPIPALRMDFLVERAGGGTGEEGGDKQGGAGPSVAVTTLELTELGFSMFGWKGGPDCVFKAVAMNLPMG